MQFGSLEYLLFLAVATLVYFVLPGARSRTAWLLGASYLFYVSLSASWTLVLLGVTVLGYVFGLLLQPRRRAEPSVAMPGRTRALLTLGIGLVLAVLCVFKFAPFVSGLVRDLASLSGLAGGMPLLRLALPVGISFWTFSTISYLVDVARGTQRVERSLPRYALFIAFFPHVAAGPIARAGQLLPQLSVKHRFDYGLMRSGLLLMLWGFLKKLVIADPLAQVVNTVYGHPHRFGGDPLVLAAATLAFAVQIYCDFSGYTDIARGAARLFGVDLLPNFDRPYQSRSVREFWRRWHMSLMSWFKDYVYIPLGGSRVGPWRRRLNILAVFLISGVWHGAGWTFVVWGLLNGGYQIAGEWLAPARDRCAGVLGLAPGGAPRNVLATATTFGLISMSWVFFRAGSLSDALFILKSMVSSAWTSSSVAALGRLGLAPAQLLVVAVATVLVFLVEWLSTRTDVLALLFKQRTAVRWAVYDAMILAVAVFGYYGPQYSASAFAYFKF